MSETRERTFTYDAELGAGYYVRVPSAFLRLPKDRYSVEAKLLYCVLLSYAGQGADAWPSESVLAANVGVGEKVIRRAMTELSKTDLVTVKRVGQGKPNRYHLHKFDEKLRKSGACNSQNGQNKNGRIDRSRPADSAYELLDKGSNNTLSPTLSKTSPSASSSTKAVLSCAVDTSLESGRKHACLSSDFTTREVNVDEVEIFEDEEKDALYGDTPYGRDNEFVLDCGNPHCCMPGYHFRHECYTPEDVDPAEVEGFEMRIDAELPPTPTDDDAPFAYEDDVRSATAGVRNGTRSSRRALGRGEAKPDAGLQPEWVAGIDYGAGDEPHFVLWERDAEGQLRRTYAGNTHPHPEQNPESEAQERPEVNTPTPRDRAAPPPQTKGQTSDRMAGNSGDGRRRDEDHRLRSDSESSGGAVYQTPSTRREAGTGRLLDRGVGDGERTSDRGAGIQRVERVSPPPRKDFTFLADRRLDISDRLDLLFAPPAEGETLSNEEGYCRAVFEAWRGGGHERGDRLGMGRYRSIREWLYGMIHDAEEDGKGSVPRKPWQLLCMAIAAMDRAWATNGEDPEGWDFENNHPTGKLRREDAFPQIESARKARHLQSKHGEMVDRFGDECPDPWRDEMRRIEKRRQITRVIKSSDACVPVSAAHSAPRAKQARESGVPYYGEQRFLA